MTSPWQRRFVFENKKFFGSQSKRYEIPDLTKLQTESYKRFLQEDVSPRKRENIGLEAVLREIFPIKNFDETISLEYLYYELEKPRFEPDECRQLRLTYGKPFKVRLRLSISAAANLGDRGPASQKPGAAAQNTAKSKSAGSIIEEDVYLGDIPIMLGGGEFIINGAERVVVSQLHRSPGIDFTAEMDGERKTFSCRIIPERGSWIELSITRKETITVKIDQGNKLPIMMFLRAMSDRYSTNDQILKSFYTTKSVPVNSSAAAAKIEGKIAVRDIKYPKEGDKANEIIVESGQVITKALAEEICTAGLKKIEIMDEQRNKLLLNSLAEDKTRTHEEALMRIYQKLRPGPAQLDRAKQLFHERFFDTNRYRLGRVGRFRVNRKLGIDISLDEMTLSAEDIVHAVNYLYFLWGGDGRAEVDDIDHLGNRRLRTIDELAGDELRKGFLKLQRTVRERFNSKQQVESPRTCINQKSVSATIEYFFGRGELSQVVDQTNPLSMLTHERRLSALGPGGLNRKRAGFEVRDVHSSHYGRICPIETPEGANIGLISSLSIYASVDEFGFLVSPYRAVKNGKLTEKIDWLRADQEHIVRLAPADVKIEKGEIIPDEITETVIVRYKGDYEPVPIEDVEYVDVAPSQMVGVSAGLIPFLEHDDANRALMGSNMQRQAVPLLVPEPPIVATGLEHRAAFNSSLLVHARRKGIVTYVDSQRVIISSDPVLGKKLLDERSKIEMKVSARTKETDEILLKAIADIKLSAPTAKACKDAKIKTLADFNENGKLRKIFASDAAVVEAGGKSPVTEINGKIKEFGFQLDAEKQICRDVILLPLRKELDAVEKRLLDSVYEDEYVLRKFVGMNERTCQNQIPIVQPNQKVEAGQILADGASMYKGELCLGRNVLVGFMAWDGFNFEDAIIISEDLVKRDTYTSIHIEEFDVEIRDQRQGREEFTCDIPNVGERALRNLDEGGIVRVGTYVRPDDILVGKVVPRTKTELSPEEKLLLAIFGRAGEDVKNESLVVPSGVEGIVIGTQKFSCRMSMSDGERDLFDREIKQIEKEEDAKIKALFEPMVEEIEEVIGRKIDADELETPKLFRLEHLNLENQPDVYDRAERVFKRYWSAIETAVDAKERKLNSKKRGDELRRGVLQMVKVYVAAKRVISVGDKMAGRHGNKGVISKILPREDMPYLADGTPVEILLNPLGVPSRMNVGQILETHLGWAAAKLGYQAVTPVFDGTTESAVNNELEKAGLPRHGKVRLFDGRTGEPFDQETTVGYIYMLKLHHLVEDKVHARSTGPYSLITQQPLGGKARFGGQRFGEMEVWALEAYGAAYTLQELLTVKSDDVEGRTKIYDSMVKGENTLEAGTPASFDVLTNEIRGLALNMQLEKGDGI
ncbi:MAG: DNA-directed RNA polymerase subunit beta [Planctomycetaceae bacterium]|nr:DNA-directed RNA polymerase subunit beta [Planctomycetaceae bacterium]